MTLRQRLGNSMRMVLSDKAIMEMNRKGLLIQGPISPQQLQPNSVDLTLANTWKKPIPNDIIDGKPVINSAKEPKYENGEFEPILLNDNTFSRPGIIIQPGEFILMASREILNIPNGILTFVQGRSSVARLGLQTEQAGLIDAGFYGTITFEVYNETPYPLVFFEGTRVAQLYFFKAMYALRPYGSKGKGSKYQEQIKATGSRIHLDPELSGMATGEKHGIGYYEMHRPPIAEAWQQAIHSYIAGVRDLPFIPIREYHGIKFVRGKDKDD